MRNLNLRQIAKYVGIWISIAFFFSVLALFSNVQARPERRISRENIVLWQAIIYCWAILFPFIIWFAAKFRIERGNWQRTVPIQLFAAFLFVFAHAVLYVLFTYLYRSLFLNQEIQILESIGKHILVNWLLDATMYFGILSAVTARDYSRRFQEEKLKSSELRAALADSRLRALKMQLHPHFLFNTLNSISTLMHEDVRAADEMVARLGDFLRLTLENSGEQVVTLAQEMNFINCYLEIESVRFGNRLKLKREIQPETLQAQVPNLILQPLIENAIKHGISRRIRPGKIIIRAQNCGENLQLQIEDDGPGLQNGSGESSGIGLANTRARLLSLYGEKHRITISPAGSQGLIVNLEIPFKINREAV